MRHQTVLYEVDPTVTLDGSMGRVGMPPRSFNRWDRIREVRETLNFWNDGRAWEIHIVSEEVSLR